MNLDRYKCAFNLGSKNRPPEPPEPLNHLEYPIFCLQEEVPRMADMTHEASRSTYCSVSFQPSLVQNKPPKECVGNEDYHMCHHHQWLDSPVSAPALFFFRISR
jgi:hypothetical protein